MAIEDEDRLLTVNEVAERLRIHPITVRRHIKAGRLRAVRVGRAVRVREHALEAFLGPEGVAGTRLARRWPPTPEETARRRKIVEEMLKIRAKMKPLGISTVELIRQARSARDWMYDDDGER